MPTMLVLTCLAVLGSILQLGVHGRQWNDTGVGTIIFEEAWTIPELTFQSGTLAPPVNQTIEELLSNLLDVHNQRLAHMDATGVDFMVLSCASPCIQGLADAANASAMAKTVNDVLADQIANNTLRFGAFASLAMQDPAEAALELNRTVTELGFLGALINDYQVSGTEDNTTFLFYDTPAYDVFWQMVVDLDVPVYLHPRTNPDPVGSLLYGTQPFIRGPVQEFANTLANHILSLCTNGVFDRFPTLKIISGHLGERIPSDLWRINDQLLRQVVKGLPMHQNVTFYLQNNVFETTSGNFGTELFLFHSSQIGMDRILYSVDYPFVSMEQGESWLNGTLVGTASLPGVLTPTELMELKRGRAIELLKLND